MNKHGAWQVSKLAFRLAVIGAMVTLAGCGDGKNFPKAHEIKGTVLVNGQPAENVQIILNRVGGEALAVPTTPKGMTNAQGEFLITSYNAEDGAPNGEYVITVEWREPTGLLKKDFDGPDRLGGAYAKVEKNKAASGFTVKVEGKAQELPPLKLTQSAEAKARAEASKRGGGLDLKGPMK
jgi:hypothetical protein